LVEVPRLCKCQVTRRRRSDRTGPT
jgi:hypothetical protein